MTPLIASLLMLLATAGLPRPTAEVAWVDGLGAVSLAGFDCVSIARSRAVSRVCHDPTRELAIAEVGGRQRAYCRVARPLVDAWLAAPSMGRFHAERIVPAHRCPDDDERP